MKENSVPSTQLQTDLVDRLSPLQKIISTENLSYIPNLYFRKYKLIESLNHQRFDFPQQKILLPRAKTSWDAVLCQMKQKSQLRKQLHKYKIAQNYHVAKRAKQQFVKKELKKQQRQLFHRIIANQLAEQVRDFFAKHSPAAVAAAQQQLQQKKQAEVENKVNNVIHDGRGTDDIFIDKHQDEDYMGVDVGGEIDFFDDILNDGVVGQNKSPLDMLTTNKPIIEQQPPAPHRTIIDYAYDFTKHTQHIHSNTMQQQQQYFLTPSHISRRACLKKINQNLRRRLKSKSNTDQTTDRSLTSATVALSGLINNYPQCKETDNFIQLPSQTDWMFDDGVRSKKRKEEEFVLGSWDSEQLQRFRQMNEKFQLSKIKDTPTLLQLTITKSQYPKIFQRNITTHYNFPSNIESIRNFSDKFNKRTFYYNEFYDQQYQKFIRSNNKRKLLERFQRNSNNMFAEHYVQEEIANDEKISVGKMFLYAPNKISDRLIYKVTPGTSKISITAKQYNKKSVPLSRQKIILLSFLVNQYLTEFGNSWKTITEFIQIFPCFSNYLVKPELVQELYQMINRHQLKLHHLENLEIWDKKILPANQLYDGSYKNFKHMLKEKSFKPDQMIDEGLATQDEQSEEANNLSLDNFEKLLNQPLQEKDKKTTFSNLSKKYKQYGKSLCAKTTNELYIFYENKVRKANKIIEEYRNTYGVTKVEGFQKHENEEKVLEYVQNNMKGEVKNGIPFRKKKSKFIFYVHPDINERNNELVKILQALRSKNTSNMPQPGTQKSLPEPSKPPLGVVKTSNVLPPNVPSTSVLPPQSMATKPSQNPSEKQQKKTKTPQKRVSGAVAPVKKAKKRQGQEDKDKK